MFDFTDIAHWAQLLLVLGIAFSAYFLLLFILEQWTIRRGRLKPLKDTNWDDIRQLRDRGQLYWAIRRLRQLKRRTGVRLTYEDAWKALNDL
ncbi:hypothetical protein O5O45_02530 [Hahella aquimaris]|uniref:hypothetical protein n=1 Tax=Hahella sp. HNIBRBA332 TaxID=3015983 RepID=UPI00273B337B|nr:hypothetical protein [Hahella sp. HNIBRBA332]WLQ14812.1 hypothetical protein O5O45_02530 [Hahella sp. HNIBRBA332]